MKMPSAKVRRWLYRVANAAVAVVVGYGLMEGNMAAVWLLLVSALLGLADANVHEGE
jgi:hypothetical protein